MTLNLHQRIASPELESALERLAESERRCQDATEAVRVADARLREATRAPGGAPSPAVAEAAREVVAARVVLEAVDVPQLDGDGWRAVRAAVEAALRYVTATLAYEPRQDPRDEHGPARNLKNPAHIEAATRVRGHLQAVRGRFAEWQIGPVAFDLRATTSLLEAASFVCDAVDTFATLADPAPVAA